MNIRLLYALPSMMLALVALALAVAGFLADEETMPVAQATQETVEARTPQPLGHRYLLAIKKLSAGDVLARDAFTTVLSKDAVPEAIKADDAPFGQPVENPIMPGELLITSKLESHSLLQRLVAPGFQALAVPVDDVSGVGGLLRPGDRVDVIASFRRSDKDKPAALRVLRNVLVLAVRGVPNVEGATDSGNSRRNSTVVLEVPEERVSELFLASTEGVLRLAAVAGGEAAVAKNEEGGSAVARAVYMNELFPSSVRATPRHPPTPTATQVQVFEGSESRYVYVR